MDIRQQGSLHPPHSLQQPPSTSGAGMPVRSVPAQSQSRAPAYPHTQPVQQRATRPQHLLSEALTLQYCAKISPIKIHQLGFLLGGDWGEMKKITFSENTEAILKKLFKQTIGNRLTAEQIAQAFYILEESQAETICRECHLPSCDQLFKPPSDHNAPLTALEALMTIRAAGYRSGALPSGFAIEMGLSAEGHQRTAPSIVFDTHTDVELEMCWQLQKEGLLTYDRLVRTLDYYQRNRFEPKQAISRKADYFVNSDKVTALSQNLSLRDLLYFIPELLDAAQLKILGVTFTDGLGAPQDHQQRTVFAISRFYKNCKGQITANDVCRFLCHPQVKCNGYAEKILAALTGAPPNDEEQLTCLDLLGLTGKIQNNTLFVKNLNLPENSLQEILQQDDQNDVCLNILSQAHRLNLLTPGNVVHALEQAGSKDLCQDVKKLRGVVAQAITPRPLPYLTDGELAPGPAPMDTDMAQQSIPLEMKHCRLCAPTYNWFRLALAMGCSLLDALSVEMKHPHYNVDALDEMWTRLLQKNKKYETGHFARALEYINDRYNLQLLPDWMKCPPQTALADISNEATQSYCLLFISECLAGKGEELGQQLGFSNDKIKNFHQKSKDSTRVILNMIQAYTSRTYSDPITLITTLTEIIEKLTGDQSSGMRRAIEATLQQQSSPSPDPRINYRTLVACEQSYQQNLEAILNSFIDIPDRFKCPITQNLIREPVSVQHGNIVQYFEKEHIEKWVALHHNNPMTREMLELSDLKEQPELRDEIQQWIHQQVIPKQGMSY